ncbi:MAG: MFS transporter [Bifidobacterium crudilactis]|jgi:MFS family permease|uniref:MFS transporter n=1 Tax=Bifidobacterium crudilactis TaxID=327277 RepID=UPI003A5C6148
MKAKSNSLVVKSAVLCISLLLTSAPAINGALPLMRNALDVTNAQNELLSTVPSFMVIIFIFLSSLIERGLGMKKTICLGLLLAGIGGVIPMFTASYPIIFASRLILGAGLGVYNSLAVSLINALYSGDTRATMLGFRNSMESIGQSVLTFIAGLLLTLGWHWSFAIYFLAFPLMVFFWITVPETSTRPQDDPTKGAEQAKERMNPFVYVLVGFAIILVLNSLAMSVRFPSIAASIRGDNFNSSYLLSLMPILGIVAGFVFGMMNKLMGKKLLYLGIAIFALSDLLMGLAANNFPLALAGLILSGIPGSWCFPYIFNTLGDITGPRTSTLATSLIFVGCNIGNFAAPLFMSAVQAVTGSDSLTIPFPVLSAIFVIIFLGVLVNDLRGHKKPEVSASN